MSLIIETDRLSKRYGKLTAIYNLSLQVEEGAIYGFVGPNGAGKTTTMRILTTLLRPNKGKAMVAGYSVLDQPREVRRAIGYMPDFFGVYDDMRTWEYLDFFAACYNIPMRERPALIDNLLELVDLSHRRTDFVDTLSRGMKQRLCLARTLAHDPKVLILDEPASGLDPRARIEIRELLVELARMGKTIFFSSHILADVAEICTHLGIIEAGHMVVQGRMEDIRRQLMPCREIIITITNAEGVAQAKRVLSAVEKVSELIDLPPEQGHARIMVKYAGSEDKGVTELLQKLAIEGVPVLNFSEETKDLEAMFMRATNGIVS